MANRRSLSRLKRQRIFDSHKGRCCLCDLPIQAERGIKWIVEHLKPLWLGGADDETNMAPAHQHCAVEKTCKEAPVKAKSDRVRSNYLGIKKQSSRPMPGNRSSAFKRKMNGEIVKR